MNRPFRHLLCGFALVFALVAGASAQTPAPTAAQRLDTVRANLEQVEQTLTRPDLSDTTLQDLRARMEPLSGTLQGALDELAPRQDSLKARMDQLGPKPDDKSPPEAASVTAERSDLQRQFEDADANLKRARLLSVRLDQANNTIVSRRRELFTRALLARNYSLFSPQLWIEVWRELPGDMRAVATVASDWWAVSVNRLQGWTLLGFVSGTIAIIVGFAVLQQAERRLVYRNPAIHDPSPFRKALAAAWVAVSTAATPIVAVAAFLGLWRSAGLTNVRLDPLLDAGFEGIMRISITVGIARGLLAPDLPNWRLLDLRDPTVDRLTRLAVTVAVFVSAAKVIETLSELIAVSLPVSIALRGTAALISAFIIMVGLRGIAGGAQDADEECLGPKVALTNRDWYGPMRLLAWVTVITILTSVVVGYVAFSAFLVDQIVWVTFIGCSLHMLMELAETGITRGFTPEAQPGRALITTIGIRRESLDQLSVVLTGIIHLSVTVAAILLALAPWGIESDDMLSSVRAAFFGFKVGDVTISLSSIIVAVLIFGLAWGFTRALQNWLEKSLLPRTQLDTGLRNSIRTSIGYIGFIVAIAFASGYLGLSFEKLAIVAGALSVGIGFGLQSIVGNFVSGLILMWERAIRVGDWIVVGDEQGYVRRINVRSTEIETFDRATMIVPNQNLVTGVVKNWVRTDKVGRIKIPINVNITADPEKVRDTLLACARSHELVQRIPSPSVFFLAMADNMLKFELVCFVADVETSGRVKSDLNFEIFRQFKEAGFDLLTQPIMPPPVTIAGLDRLESVLDRAAAAKG